jgi:hypothetical protein
MTDLELVRALRQLRRSADMLRTELRHGRVDEGLLAEIEDRMERGIGTDVRSESLRPLVDMLRESLITPRPELLQDTIRACDKLMDAVEGIVARIG